MAEQSKQQQPKQQQPKEPKPPRRSLEWGLTQQDVLEALAGQPVECVFSTGGELRGALVGYDQFHLVLKVGSAVVLVRKGALETLRAA